jgi:hypothetical protein
VQPQFDTVESERKNPALLQELPLKCRLESWIGPGFPAKRADGSIEGNEVRGHQERLPSGDARSLDDVTRWIRFQRIVRFAKLLLALVIFILAAPPPAAASDYQFKAAYILNFANLTLWPQNSFRNPTDPFAICLVGTDEVHQLFEKQYDGLIIANRPVAILKVSKPSELSGCQIVMITADAEERIDEFIEATEGTSILTIGETQDFAQQGGIIGFYKDESKIRFEINQGAAQNARLRISSRLLRLARLVSGGDD